MNNPNLKRELLPLLERASREDLNNLAEILDVNFSSGKPEGLFGLY